jgi:hypothetical protein
MPVRVTPGGTSTRASIQFDGFSEDEVRELFRLETSDLGCIRLTGPWKIEPVAAAVGRSQSTQRIGRIVSRGPKTSAQGTDGVWLDVDKTKKDEARTKLIDIVPLVGAGDRLNRPPPVQDGLDRYPDLQSLRLMVPRRSRVFQDGLLTHVFEQPFVPEPPFFGQPPARPDFC